VRLRAACHCCGNLGIVDSLAYVIGNECDKIIRHFTYQIQFRPVSPSKGKQELSIFNLFVIARSREGRNSRYETLKLAVRGIRQGHPQTRVANLFRERILGVGNMCALETRRGDDRHGLLRGVESGSILESPVAIAAQRTRNCYLNFPFRRLPAHGCGHPCYSLYSETGGETGQGSRVRPDHLCRGSS